MANQEIINYIKQCQGKGFPKEQIIQALKGVGWQDAEIEEGFKEPETVALQRNSPSRLKLFAIGGIIVFLLAGGIFGWQYFSAPKKEAPKTNTPAETAPKIETVKPADIAWDIFQNTLMAVKERDLNKMNSLSYEQYSISDCIEGFNISEKECWDLVGSVYSQGEKFKKADFVNITEDEKQILMSTNYISNTEGYSKSKLYFIKDSKGNLLLLQISTSVLNTASIMLPIEEKTKEIEEMMRDTDSDGLTDSDEKCLRAQAYNPKCVKTNPNLKDTDGDGWWDSMEEKAGSNPNDIKSTLIFK